MKFLLFALLLNTNGTLEWNAFGAFTLEQCRAISATVHENKGHQLIDGRIFVGKSYCAVTDKALAVPD